MKIGQLANECSVSVQTIRYYERRGVLYPSGPNSSSGYRNYNDHDKKKLKFIKQMQNLGFSLGEIDELLLLKTSRKLNCGRVKTKAHHKLCQVQEKIKSLRGVEKALNLLIKKCEESGSNSCHLLEQLN